jgi:NADH-quinone oxidoreductase subunit L
VKRVLAWSTVSQLAYMLGALAVGGVAAGAFHLLTHAAFKALLFLCAGVILHATGSVLMSRLGGLRHAMPITYVATVVGGLALVGVPPVSGWLSKDAVLEAAWTATRGDLPAGVTHWVAVVVLASALGTVALTAAYMTRLVLRTFHGSPRSDAAAHDPPPLMRWPILLLALVAVVHGVIGVRRTWLPTWIGAPDEAVGANAAATVIAVALAAGGALLVAAAWRRAPAEDPVRLLGRQVADALRNGLHVDSAQERLVVRPWLRLARLVSTADSVLVDGAVESTGTGSQRLGRLLARLEAGNVQLYLTGLAAGAVLVAFAVAVAA